VIVTGPSSPAGCRAAGAGAGQTVPGGTRPGLSSDVTRTRRQARREVPRPVPGEREASRGPGRPQATIRF